MKFKSFGDTSLPGMIILHGGGLSWWSLEPVVNILKDTYHVVTPVIDGHGEDGETTFISIADSAEKIVSHIDQHFGGRVSVLAGLSIGAQIVLKALSIKRDVCEYAIIESALIKPLGFLNSLLIPMTRMAYPLIKNKAYSRLQAKTLFVPEDAFDRYYEDSRRMTKTSLVNITRSNGSFTVGPELAETSAKVLIMVGEKEIKMMKESAEKLHDIIGGSTLKILPDRGHGETSLLHPREYCSLVLDFVKPDRASGAAIPKITGSRKEFV